jgi:hypothetical protein
VWGVAAWCVVCAVVVCGVVWCGGGVAVRCCCICVYVLMYLYVCMCLYVFVCLYVIVCDCMYFMYLYVFVCICMYLRCVTLVVCLWMFSHKMISIICCYCVLGMCVGGSSVRRIDCLLFVEVYSQLTAFENNLFLFFSFFVLASSLTGFA